MWVFSGAAPSFTAGIESYTRTHVHSVNIRRGHELLLLAAHEDEQRAHLAQLQFGCGCSGVHIAQPQQDLPGLWGMGGVLGGEVCVVQG